MRFLDAPEEIAGLIAPVPARPQRFLPNFRYLLLDEGSHAESELAPLRNLAAELFRMENSRTPQDVERFLAALIAGWKHPTKVTCGKRPPSG